MIDSRLQSALARAPVRVAAFAVLLGLAFLGAYLVGGTLAP